MLHFRLIIIGFFMVVMTYFSYGDIYNNCSCNNGYWSDKDGFPSEIDNTQIKGMPVLYTKPAPANTYTDDEDCIPNDSYIHTTKSTEYTFNIKSGYYNLYDSHVQNSYEHKICNTCSVGEIAANNQCLTCPDGDCDCPAPKEWFIDIEGSLICSDGNNSNPPPPEGNDTNPPPPEGNNSNPPPGGDGGGGDGGDGGGGDGGGGTGSTDNNQTTDGNTTNPPPTDGNTTNPPIGTGGGGGGEGDGTAVVVNGGKCDAGQIFCTYTNVCQFTNLPCRPTSDCPDGYHPADNYETTGKCEQDKETTCKNPSTFFGRPFKGIMNQSACDKIKNAKGFICAHDHALVACYYKDATVPTPDTDDDISTDGDGSDKDYTAILKKINSNIKKDTSDTSDMLTQLDGTLKLNNSNNQKSLDAINKTLEVKLDTLNDSTVANNNKLANLVNRMEVNTYAVQQNGSNAASQRGWMINQLTGLQNINKAINSNADKIAKNTKETAENTKEIKDGIKNIGKSEDGTYGDNFTDGNNGADNNTSINVDNEKINTINENITSMTEDITDIKELGTTVKEKFTEFTENINGAYETLQNDLTLYETMFSTKPQVNMPSAGSCNLAVNVPVFNTTFDPGQNLCSILNNVAPFFQFIFTIITQLSLIYLFMRYFRVKG